MIVQTSNPVLQLGLRKPDGSSVSAGEGFDALVGLEGVATKDQAPDGAGPRPDAAVAAFFAVALPVPISAPASAAAPASTDSPQTPAGVSAAAAVAAEAVAPGDLPLAHLGAAMDLPARSVGEAAAQPDAMPQPADAAPTAMSAQAPSQMGQASRSPQTESAVPAPGRPIAPAAGLTTPPKPTRQAATEQAPNQSPTSAAVPQGPQPEVSVSLAYAPEPPAMALPSVFSTPAIEGAASSATNAVAVQPGVPASPELHTAKAKPASAAVEAQPGAARSPILTMAAALAAQADGMKSAGAKIATDPADGETVEGHPKDGKRASSVPQAATGVMKFSATVSAEAGAQASPTGQATTQGFSAPALAVNLDAAPQAKPGSPKVEAGVQPSGEGKSDKDKASDAATKTKVAAEAAVAKSPAAKPEADVGEAVRAQADAPQTAASPDRASAQPQTAAAPAAPSSAQPASPPSLSASAQVAAAAQVAEQIVNHVSQRRTRFEVQLDPGGLGRVDVRLDIGHDGRVSTRLIVEKPETLDMLRNDARELSRTLEQAGFQLGQGGLAFQLKDSRQALWTQDTANPSSATGAEDDVEELVPAAAAYARGTASAAGGVDRTV